MKKWISFMLAAISMVTLSACGSAEGADNSSAAETSAMHTIPLSSDPSALTGAPENVPDGAESNNNTAGNKTLVAYFSATGTTRLLAEYAADVLEADLYEIVPKQPYTEADLAYYTDGRADQEQSDPAARPAIAGDSLDMSQYQVIMVGYPIWHGQAPKILSTFLESYDFQGKP